MVGQEMPGGDPAATGRRGDQDELGPLGVPVTDLNPLTGFHLKRCPVGDLVPHDGGRRCHHGNATPMRAGTGNRRFPDGLGAQECEDGVPERVFRVRRVGVTYRAGSAVRVEGVRRGR